VPMVLESWNTGILGYKPVPGMDVCPCCVCLCVCFVLTCVRRGLYSSTVLPKYLKRFIASEVIYKKESKRDKLKNRAVKSYYEAKWFKLYFFFLIIPYAFVRRRIFFFTYGSF
jgi:hypothetical protein